MLLIDWYLTPILTTFQLYRGIFNVVGECENTCPLSQHDKLRRRYQISNHYKVKMFFYDPDKSAIFVTVLNYFNIKSS